MKSILLFSSVLCFSAYADVNPNRVDYLEAAIDDLRKQVAEVKNEATERTINPPSGPAVSGGADVFVTGSFLYWKANEDGLTYVLKAPLADAAGLNVGNGDFSNPHFDWDVGFRLGLGWNPGHDHWDLYFSWTRFHTAAHGHRHASATKSLWPVLSDGTFASWPTEKASTYLRIHLNVLDLELGREFYVGNFLSVRPHVGLENIWISQHDTTHYRGHLTFNASSFPDDFNTVSFRNNFWGIGARAGVKTEWQLGAGFSFIGDVAWALLYGEFDLKRKSTIVNTPINPRTGHYHFDEDLTQAKAAMEFCLGMRWDLMFAGDRFHLGVQAGWEQHIYFGQNHLFNPIAFGQTSLPPGKGTFANNDLTFQGLTVSLRLDF